MSALADRGRDAWRKLSPMDRGILASVLLHGGLWLVLSWSWDVHVTDEAVSALEIDLTRPFRITDDPSKERRAVNPGAGAPVVYKPTLLPGRGTPGGEEHAPPVETPSPAKEWILPTPETKQVEPPAPAGPAGVADGTGEGPGLGGLGGEGEGEVDWVYMTALPKLLNAEKLRQEVLRFYPATERAADRQGWVRVELHVNVDGRVTSVSVIESSEEIYEGAARRAMGKARFSPARVGTKKVPFKVIQQVEFNLDE